MSELSLGQISRMSEEIATNQWIYSNYDVLDYDSISEKVAKISDKQRAFFWAMVYNENYIKLAELLDSIGFERIQLSTDETVE